MTKKNKEDNLIQKLIEEGSCTLYCDFRTGPEKRSAKMAILRVLGFIWTLPVSLLMWIFMLFCLLFKQVDKVYARKDLTFVWVLKRDSWFDEKLLIGRGYAGFAVGNNIIYSQSTVRDIDQIIKHESRHCQQYYLFGVLFLPIYACMFLYISFFIKHKHPYLDNPFEIDARRYTGEEI